VGVRNRVIATYILWGIAALGTTLTWVSTGGVGFSGQTGGLNGTMTMFLAIGTAALIAWWDSGNRLDPARLRVATFVGFLVVAVIVRNVYDIVDAQGHALGYGILISLFASLPALALTWMFSKG